MKDLLTVNIYVFINIESSQELENIAKKICEILNCNDFEFTLFGIPESDLNISENDVGYQLEIYPVEGKPIDQLNNTSLMIVKELNEKYNINSWI